MDSQVNSTLDYTGALKRLLTSDSTPKLGLQRIARILEALGNPERKFRSIHVAGTNGKGSTCALLAAALKEQYVTGLYTSPHLLSARERIQINGHLISEQLFCEAEAAIDQMARKAGEQPTFFERMTAMSFWAFAQAKVEIAVVEVGLGGRLDSTNVIQPLACAITSISLDHCEFLGNTVAQIATEKAGIIKPGTPVVTGWQEPAALIAIAKVASERGAPLIEVRQPFTRKLSLSGKHQTRNAALALATLNASGLNLASDQIEHAFANTRWPCRLEKIPGHPIVIDGAHNPDGMRALVGNLPADGPLTFIVGTTKGHDVAGMIEALEPLRARIQGVVLTKSRSPRAADPTELAKRFADLAPCEVIEAIPAAIEHALARGGLTIVAGSLYVAGEARSLFFEMPIDAELPVY